MGSPVSRVGDIEINQDLCVQERTWRFQRAGWVAMALLALLGLTGLFGHGPVSRATAGKPADALWVEYERFGRYLDASVLKIHAQPSRTGVPLRLWIASEYLTHVTVQQVTPSPSRTVLSEDGIVFEFTTAEDADRVLITMSLQFQSIGRLTGRLGLTNADPVRLGHFVYP